MKTEIYKGVDMSKVKDKSKYYEVRQGDSNGEWYSIEAEPEYDAVQYNQWSKRSAVAFCKKLIKGDSYRKLFVVEIQVTKVFEVAK